MSRYQLKFYRRQRGYSMMFYNFAAFSVLLLFLAGCAVGPDYTAPPKAPELKTWQEKEDPKIKSDTTTLSQWWTVFNDQSLNEIIETAYSQNLPLRIAGIRILEARARLGIAIGRQYPQTQQGVGAYSYDSRSENAPNTAFGDLNYQQLGIGFDAAWELDFWGKFRRAVQSGVGTVEASIANYDNVLVTLTAEAARNYVAIRIFETRLAIARENVELQERSLKIAEARFKGGEVSELDVAQARALLRETQALIPRLETGLRQAKNALSILLGLPPSNLQEILTGPQIIPKVPNEVAVGVPAELLRRRPDIRSAERQVAAQSARIGVAKADLYPHFTLFGSIGLVTSDSTFTKTGGSGLGDLFQGNSLQYAAGTGFRWDLFNYGRIRNRVRVQDARFQALVVNYKNAVLKAAQEVEDAMVAFLRSQEEAEYLSDSVSASIRSVELSMIQYREGLVDYQRVIDSQRTLAQAQDLYASTFGSVSVNLISMYKALGGGWEIREGKPFVPEEIRVEMANRTNWGSLLAPAKLEVPPSEQSLEKIWWPDW